MSENKTKITLIPTTSDDELFLKYQTQCQPQDALLCLNLETGELSAYYDSNIGGSTSGRVWHNLDVEWIIPPLKMKPLENLMNEVKSHCETILEDSRVEWDGSNWRGYLGNDADLAKGQVGNIIDGSNFDPSQIWGSWDASDWFCEYLQCQDESAFIAEHEITRKTSDEQIEKLAEKLEEEAKNEHDITLEDTEGYLKSLRDDLRDTRADKIDCDHENYSPECCSQCGYESCYECAPNNRSEGPSPERAYFLCPVCGHDIDAEVYGGEK